MRHFCAAACRNAREICQDMDANLREYVDVKNRYPKNVFIVRYEDVSKDVMKFSQDFFPNILNLSMNENIVNFIQTHTKNDGMNHGNIASTIRKSKNHTFIWTERLNENKIASFDSFCSHPMELAGYKSYVEGKGEGKELEDIYWLKDMKL